MKIFGQLADDEFGSVDTMGYILMVTLLAIGGITGLATLRDGIIQEGGDIFNALRSLDQSFSIWVPDNSGLEVVWTDDGNDPPVYNNPTNATNIKFSEADFETDSGITGVPGASTAGQPPNGMSLSIAGVGEGAVLPSVPGTTFEPSAVPGEGSAVPTPISSPLYPSTSFPAPTGPGG